MSVSSRWSCRVYIYEGIVDIDTHWAATPGSHPTPYTPQRRRRGGRWATRWSHTCPRHNTHDEYTHTRGSGGQNVARQHRTCPRHNTHDTLAPTAKLLLAKVLSGILAVTLPSGVAELWLDATPLQAHHSRPRTSPYHAAPLRPHPTTHCRYLHQETQKRRSATTLSLLKVELLCLDIGCTADPLQKVIPFAV